MSKLRHYGIDQPHYANTPHLAAGRCRSSRQPRILVVGDAKPCRALIAEHIRASGMPLVKAKTPLDAIVHLQADEWTTRVVIAGSLATADLASFLAFMSEVFPDVEITNPCANGGAETTVEPL